MRLLTVAALAAVLLGATSRDGALAQPAAGHQYVVSVSGMT